MDKACGRPAQVRWGSSVAPMDPRIKSEGDNRGWRAPCELGEGDAAGHRTTPIKNKVVINSVDDNRRLAATNGLSNISLPPCGGGSGRGVSKRMHCGQPDDWLLPSPLLDPPPQGGRRLRATSHDVADKRGMASAVRTL